MTIFWLSAAVLSALAGLLVLSAARRGAAPGGDVLARAAGEELAELDRLKARGLLDEAGWTQARAEAARRMLAIGRAGDDAAALRAADPRWLLAAVAATAAAALGVYVVTGAPGMPDQAYERRVDGWAADLDRLEPAQMAAVVARVARERPGDRQAWAMLGAARFEAGDPVGAASAFRRALELDPGDAQSWARLGESLVRAQDGVVGADAEAAFMEAVRHDPGQLGALYFLGEAAAARGDRAGAAVRWEPLMAALSPGDPRRADLASRLAALETAPAGAAR